jgi:murein DD-endopeptidase MepM/ murein hydrolase activator NlpD
MAQLSTGAMIVVDDGSPTGSDLAARVSEGTHSEPVVVRVKKAREGLIPAALRVKRKKIIGAAIAEAKRRHLLWVALPRDFDTPQAMLGSLLKAEGLNTTSDVPGVVVWLRTPGVSSDITSALVVVDVREEAMSSGLTVRAAVAVAKATDAALDVALLGVPRDADLSSWERRQDAMKFGRQRDLIAGARELAEEDDITVRDWIPLGEPADATASVIDLLRAGGYDVVLDDLGDVDLGRVRHGRSLRQILSAGGGVGEIPLRLVREAPCDVVLVIDDVRIGRLSSTLVRGGAMGAMTLGVLGAAVPASAAPASAPTAVTATVSTGQVDSDSTETEKETKAKEKKGEADAKAQEDMLTPADVAVPEDLTEEQVDQQVAEAEQARQQVAQTQQELDQAKQRSKSLEKKTSSVADAVPTTQMDLEMAKFQVTSAEQQLADAEAELAETVDDASGLTGFLPGGATDEDVATAEDAVGEAEESLERSEAERDEARAAADQAYEEYQTFLKDVEKAERNLTQAEKDANAAKELVATEEVEAQAYVEAWEEQNRVVMPGTGDITSAFGYRIHPISGQQKLHTGTDFSVGDGNIYAAAGGTVSFAGYGGGYGNYVVIDHGTYDGHQIETLYAHQPGIQVAVGQQVEAGQQIGNVGTTGSSTGLHLHFELHVDGQAVDAMPYLPAA